MALEDRAAEAWDWAAHYRAQQALHGDPSVPFYGWHYPPPFLLSPACSHLLPYLAALFVWQAATLTAAAAATVRAIVPGRHRFAGPLGAPVVFICLSHGHNGFLTAALFGGGAADPRPAAVRRGAAAGLPDLQAAIRPAHPAAAARRWHWRAIAGAFVSAAALTGLTLAIWGWPVWQAFLDSLPLTREW